MYCRSKSMEYHLSRSYGMWKYEAACSDCGWTSKPDGGALSRFGAVWLLRKQHRLRQGVSSTAPCVVCDKPSKVGSPLCGDKACAAALAEVRREMPSPLGEL
jgi:hypothetical protein